MRSDPSGSERTACRRSAALPRSRRRPERWFLRAGSPRPWPVAPAGSWRRGPARARPRPPRPCPIQRRAGARRPGNAQRADRRAAPASRPGSRSATGENPMADRRRRGSRAPARRGRARSRPRPAPRWSRPSGATTPPRRRRLLERAVDHRGIALARHDAGVPPDREPAGLEQAHQWLNRGPIVTFVAEENIGHNPQRWSAHTTRTMGPFNLRRERW